MSPTRGTAASDSPETTIWEASLRPNKAGGIAVENYLEYNPSSQSS